MSITKLNNLSISAVTALPSGVGGKVLQVVTATDSTQRSTTSTSFVTASSTLTLSITPSSASNKIFVICSTFIQPDTGQDTYITLYRDSTNLGASNGMGNIYSSSVRTNGTLTVLDSPATTSATTYEFRMKVSGSTSYINANSTKGSITAFEIAG